MMHRKETEKSVVYRFDEFDAFGMASAPGASFVGTFIVPKEHAHRVQEGNELGSLLNLYDEKVYGIVLRKQWSRAKRRRTWVYYYPPKAYEMAPCDCGNEDTHWSEFEGHLWCDRCQKDFIPKHNGLFDGPIPVRVAAKLGVRFDRVILATDRLDRFDMDAGKWESEKERP